MDKGVVIGGLAGLGAGVIIGKVTTALGTSIPQYLVDIANNLQCKLVSGTLNLQLRMERIRYQEFRYKWAGDSSTYTRKSGVFAFTSPSFVLPDGTTKFDEGNDIVVLVEIIDWTEETPKYIIDICRLDIAQVEIYYKGELQFTFPEIPVAPKTVQPGFALIHIDPATGNVI